MAKNEIIGFAEVAELMDISVEGARKAARTDSDFPPRVTPPSMRSPGFDRAAIERYIDRRANRSGRSGRPPAAGGGRMVLSDAVNQRLLQRIREAGPFAEFVKLARLSDQGLRQRFSGKSRWRNVELEAFAKRLETTVDELIAE